MEKILGIIGAMEEEISSIKSKMEVTAERAFAKMTFYEGKLANKNIVLALSGMGKVNIGMCAQILVDKFNVAALLNLGVAGTMNKKLKQGDLVISTRLVQHDFDTSAFGDPVGFISRIGIRFLDANPKMIALAKKAAAECGINAIEGFIATGDQFVTKENQKKIIENFGFADAVDMESAAMAQAAWLNEIPFVVLRSISDSADGQAVISFEQFKNFAAENAARIVEKFVENWK